MKTYSRITVVNPIVAKFSGRFGALCCWSQFVEKWELAKTPQEWESLLHQGYNLSFEQLRYGETKFTPVDRTIFYLSCADDENLHIEGEDQFHRYHPVSQDGKVVELTNYQMKVRLVEKAMTMICQNEFKPWIEKQFDWYHPDPHMEYFTSPDLLPVLMHFFGDKNHPRGFVHCNVHAPHKWGMTHTQEQTFEFVMKLIEVILLWNVNCVTQHFYSNDESKISEHKKFVDKTIARFSVAKAWAVQMLASLGELDLLWKLRSLEPVVVRTLQLVELYSTVGEGKDKRLVRNHQEALKTGSKVAWFLHKYYFMNDLCPDEKVTKCLRSKIARR